MSNNNLIDNRQIRVFISSTFRDMQDERDYLMKRTFPKLRKLAAERDVTLTELDLRWGITEEESKSGKVVEICLREIENSIPFFIGIIGNRYGWTPDRSDLTEYTTEQFPIVKDYLDNHLSVTEMEMQFGVLAREEDMHAYFFIKEQEDEKQDNPEMLERLKEEVMASRYPSNTYSSPEDLALQVEKEFALMLDELFPFGELSNVEKERIGQRSFMNQLCQNYIRDEKYFNALNDWMDDWTQHQLVVTGASGLGKSALIANWLKEKLQDTNREYNIIYHFTGNGGSESSYDHIIETICSEINNYYGWTNEDDENGPFTDKIVGGEEEKEMTKIEKLFVKVQSEGKQPLLLVLDAVNQIANEKNAKSMNWIPAPPPKIKILFSTLDTDRTMEMFRQRNYPTISVYPLDKKQRVRLVEEYIGAFAKKLKSKQIQRIVNSPQSENTLVLKTILEELINFGIYEKLDDRIDYYLSPNSIEDFYQALLQSYEQDYALYSTDFIKHILSLISVSQKGLSEDEILDIIKEKPLYWSQFYCAFSSHLTNKNGLISFSHQYISDTIHKRYVFNNLNWNLSCRHEIIELFKTRDNSRAWIELAYQYYKIKNFSSLYLLLQRIPVFEEFYKNYRKTLTNYWKKLKEKGYDYAIYQDLLKSYKEEEKSSIYKDFIYFFRSAQFSLNFAMMLCLDYIEWTEKDMGKEHLDTACAYHTMGMLYFWKKDYKMALNFYFKALHIREEILGVKHLDTATTYHGLGVVYIHQNDYSRALDFFQKALFVYENVLGEKHPDTISYYNCIGHTCHVQNDYPRALEFYFKQMSILEQLNNGLETAKLYNNIGDVFKSEREFQKALDYYQKALSIRESELGVEHIETSYSYENIGSLYNNQGNYAKALEYYLKELSILEKLQSEEIRDITRLDRLYSIISFVYEDQGDYKNYLEFFMKAMNFCEKIHGIEHERTAVYYNKMGTIYKNLGELPKALEFYLKALSIRKKVLGEENPMTALSYEALGNYYKELSDYPKALEYYQNTLSIRDKTNGEGSQASIGIINKIGSIYHTLGNYSNALQYRQKVLNFHLRKSGETNLKTAQAYNNIGAEYRGLKQYDKSLEYITKAYDIAADIGDDIAKATYLNRLGRTLAAMGDLSTAHDKFQTAITLVPKDHPVAIDSRKRIEVLNK